MKPTEQESILTLALLAAPCQQVLLKQVAVDVGQLLPIIRGHWEESRPTSL